MSLIGNVVVRCTGGDRGMTSPAILSCGFVLPEFCRFSFDIVQSLPAVVVMASFSKHQTKAKAKPKPKPKPKKPSHKDLISKWAAQGGAKFVPKKVYTHGEKSQKREASIKAKAAPQPGDAEEEEEERSQQTPHEQACERMANLARQLQKTMREQDAEALLQVMDPSERQSIAECLKIQLDELMVLEAVFMDELMLVPDDIDSLRETMQTLEDEGFVNECTISSIINRPPLEFSLQLTIQDQRQTTSFTKRELVATVLLNVTFPPLYPTPGASVELEFVDVMITDALEECGYISDVLQTLEEFEEERLMKEMLNEAAHIQGNEPIPVVFELTTWLSENAFQFLTKSSGDE